APFREKFALAAILAYLSTAVRCSTADLTPALRSAPRHESSRCPAPRSTQSCPLRLPDPGGAAVLPPLPGPHLHLRVGRGLRPRIPPRQAPARLRLFRLHRRLHALRSAQRRLGRPRRPAPRPAPYRPVLVAVHRADRLRRPLHAGQRPAGAL